MSEQTEIEQALEIARKTRNEILFGKNTLEKNFHGFYTVAQILGRENDMIWTKAELEGYSSNCPTYRMNVSRVLWYGTNQIKEMITNPKTPTHCDLSIAEIEKHLDPKQKMPIQYALTDDDFDLIRSYAKSNPNMMGQIFTKKEELYWEFYSTDLTQMLSAAKLELVRRINILIAEITYGKIPEGIFKRFQDNVNSSLANSNPAAVSELNISYEGLGKSEDPERIAHVAFACRRLIKAVADNLFPSKEQDYITKGGDKLKVGNGNFLNRLEAYVDSIDSSNRKFLIRKIKLLRDLYGEVPESINKGTHLTIKNADAEMLVIYTYTILGDMILEKISTKSSTDK